MHGNSGCVCHRSLFDFHNRHNEIVDVNNNSSRKYFDVLNISSGRQTQKIKRQTTQSFEHCTLYTTTMYCLSHISCNRHYLPDIEMKKVSCKSPETTDTVHSLTLQPRLGGIEMKKKKNEILIPHLHGKEQIKWID